MKRIVFLDYVRVFACFLVMVVHASENFYGAAGSTDMAGPQSYLANEADRLWVAVYDGFSRMAVPLVHDCLCLFAGTDERGADLMAILSPPLHSYPAAVFHIYDIIFYPANVVGTARWRNIIKGLVSDTPEFPDACRTLLVHVSSDQPLPVYTYYISMVE